MDDRNREDPQQTPFQTPVRGADEQAGSGTQDTQNTAGSTPPPHSDPSYYEQWSGGQKKPHKKHHFPWKPVVVGLLVAGVAFGGGLWFGGDHTGGASNPTHASNAADGLPEDRAKRNIHDSGDDVASYADIYKKVSPSVVAIVVDEIQLGAKSSGSGVIMNSEGYVITNNHVVQGGDRYTVVLNDSTSYQAQLIGTDEQTDLAVIKIDGKDLVPAEFGSSEDLQVGDRAFAIGSPGGIEFQNSFTGGFISAINRDVTINDRVMNLIQTDTAINPGNSGGALINSEGQVIGITSSKLSAGGSGSASIEGMGFAIPTTTVKEVCDQLIAYGHVTGRPAIGISGYDVDEMRAYYYDIPQGVMVTDVDMASDAYAKGIRPGDMIIGADGEEITSMKEVNAIKNKKKAGDTMELTIYRGDKTMKVTIALIDQTELSGKSAQPAAPQPQAEQQNPFGGYGYRIP